MMMMTMIARFLYINQKRFTTLSGGQIANAVNNCFR